MQTNLADFIKNTPDGDEAEAILRACVHCGFCTATCPTYQLLGDELDGPRGRIYLIKQVLEGAEATQARRLHLDRCLTCRNCESTCPSGVQYGRLVDIGRKVVEQRVQRPLGQRIQRYVLKEGLPRGRCSRPRCAWGRWRARCFRSRCRTRFRRCAWPGRGRAPACAQDAGAGRLRAAGMAPNINAATARVLDAVGVQLIAAPKAGCCGALRFHMNDQDGGMDDMRRNIDAWWPYVEAGSRRL
jgi:glycolate oxidase iron-sulfur subunit